jgi:hypothetical protein
MVPPKETDRHIQAFELYFKNRNVSEVSREIGVTRQSIDKWRKWFLWEDKCVLREKKVAEKLEGKVVDGIVDKKAKMLHELDNLDIMVDQEIITAFVKDDNGNTVPKLHIVKLRDFIDLMKLKLSINDNRIRVLGEEVHNVAVSGVIENKTTMEETLVKYADAFKEVQDKS